MTHDAGAEAAPAPGRLAGLPSAPRCLVMGVVNVTPDSFSDGGSWLDPDAAVARGAALAAAGADLVDVGGESTRPGAQRIAGRGRAAPGHAGDYRAGRGRHLRERGYDAGRGGRAGAARRRAAWSTT